MQPDTTHREDPATTQSVSGEDSSRADLNQTGESMTPRANLYASDDGWVLIAALPQADQKQATLETEGAKLILSVPHRGGGKYRRAIRFPKGTIWGDLSARWEGDLLYVTLPRAIPERRLVSIS